MLNSSERKEINNYSVIIRQKSKKKLLLNKKINLIKRLFFNRDKKRREKIQIRK